MECIWCGEPIDEAVDGASFLFLAKREGHFNTVSGWLNRSPHLEGHQFFCHAGCFRASVPEQRQWLLTYAIDED